jgi:hypothetical protein
MIYPIKKEDKNRLYLQTKHTLGYPIRPFELEEDMLDSYLEMVIEDYSALLNNWLIEQQWVGLEGMSIETGDFLNAYATKSNDYVKSFTYAYSKQVGLGTNAPAAHGWELKRDYIITAAHTQHYIIPAGREVNEVLWETPSEIDFGLVDPFASTTMTAGGFGWSFNSRPANMVQPTYSLLLAAQDRGLKQRIMKSTMSYRITGLETGEKVLHLYPIPGDKYEIAGKWGKHYEGKKVWYFYYDTSKDGNRDKCLEENSDIVRLISDPPTQILKWDNLNDVAKKHIRDLFIAKVKISVGGIRGFYSGNVGSVSKELSLDYRHLLDEGQKEEETTIKLIMDSLEKLKQVNLTTERAQIAENVNKALGYQPFMHPIITI